MRRSPDNLKFAARLAEAMKRSRKKIETATQLALQFNLQSSEQITPQAAQNWLSGYNRPTQSKAETLAAMFDVSAHWLLHGAPEMRPAKRASKPTQGALRPEPSPVEWELLERLRRLPEHQQHLVQDIVGQFALSQEVWSATEK